MRHSLKRFNIFLTSTFYKLGKTIARHTGYFIIVPLLLTALCATGFQRIVHEDDPEYLFAPSNGAARSERAVIEANFKLNYTYGFDPARMTRNGRFARLIIVAKDNGTLLREEVWDEIMFIDSKLHQINFTYDGETLKYEDICAIWNEDCFENQALDLGGLLPQFLNGSLELNYPVMVHPEKFEFHVFPLYFGGFQLRENRTIDSVQALNLFYWARTKDEKEDRK